MNRAAVRSFVFAVEFRITESARVGPVLARHEESLRDLGAQYAFMYESVVEPGKVLRCRRTIRSIINSHSAQADRDRGSKV